MQNLDQFNALTAREAMDINGGAGLDSVLAIVNGVLTPAVSATLTTRKTLASERCNNSSTRPTLTLLVCFVCTFI